jgi:hypothetical protein
MVKNLFEYADTPIQEEKQPEQKDKDQKISKEDISQLYNKYKDMPQEQLVEEFVKSAKAQRTSGALDDNKINQIYSTLCPYLNNQQKEFFDTLIHKIDE